ncbi:MAG: hypothetical protein AMXMBFR84_01030 [Candidatus Hydrogenedentota bacterium]
MSKLSKANVRVRNTEHITDDMAIVFVVNHFTRLETILLPYYLNKHTGREVWSLAAAELFRGRIGQYLLTMGNVSTKDPDRDRIMVRTLILGEHPWIIFPEGAMMKNKKVVDRRGMFQICLQGKCRLPHTGAAVIALRAEFYRRKLQHLKDDPAYESVLKEVSEQFDLQDLGSALTKRTVIVPVNVTYFPIRAEDNVVLRVARGVAKDLSKRALEELSVEGTVLSQNTDIDITLGPPIDIGEYLDAAEFQDLLTESGDPVGLQEEDVRSKFSEAGRRLMVRYMTDIYNMTTVNYDHVIGTVVRNQRARRSSERTYGHRIYLATERLRKVSGLRLHPGLEKTYRDLAYDEPCPYFQDFMEVCIKDGVLEESGDGYIKRIGLRENEADFHTVRQDDLPSVIANEIEPMPLVTSIIQNVAYMPHKVLGRHIRDQFQREDECNFELDYAEYAIPGESKPPAVGRPFLLLPERVKGGMVLIHGYMAAPLEVRNLAEYFYQRGYAVYGVRLKGHGTSPEDLAQTRWEEWYESMNRGYAIIKTLTDNIVIGGFSTGGALALLAAGRKRDKVKAVFSICAPQTLRNYMARFASSIVSMNTLMSKITGGGKNWEYVENNPENPHINYTRNPLRGVKQLGELMKATETALPDICVPTLIVQSYGDPIINPVSAMNIFEGVGTHLKELTVFDRPNHGIINGAHSEEVFDRVERFLTFARSKSDAALASEAARKRVPETPRPQRFAKPAPETGDAEPVAAPA